MRQIACVLTLLACLELAAGCSSSATPSDDAADGWRPLAAAEDLDGWVTRGGKGRFSVARGEIRGVIPAGTPSTFLCTEREYGDFVMELEFRISVPMNSGIQIRSHAREKDGRVFGYQVELDPSERAWTGGIYDEARRGWLDDLKEEPAARAAFRQGAWNHLRIEARGNRLRSWLNGVPAGDLVDDADSTGFIALQLHSHRQPTPQEVRWRSLRIKPLD